MRAAGQFCIRTSATPRPMNASSRGRWHACMQEKTLLGAQACLTVFRTWRLTLPRAVQTCVSHAKTVMLSFLPPWQATCKVGTHSTPPRPPHQAHSPPLRRPPSPNELLPPPKEIATTHSGCVCTLERKGRSRERPRCSREAAEKEDAPLSAST